MGARLRRRVVLAGTVQGVGFRLWAVRQARELGLDGWAANERDRLIIEIEREVAPLDAFVKRLQRIPPALARVELIEIAEIAADGARGFDVAPSTAGAGPALAVPVDVATCAACVQEMRDPLARRFRYPFTNCSNCGPIDIPRRERLKTVALTGGVFQNALLTSLVEGAIVDAGLEVLVHRRVPPNDGGISIGQAAIAAATC